MDLEQGLKMDAGRDLSTSHVFDTAEESEATAARLRPGGWTVSVEGRRLHVALGGPRRGAATD